MSSDVIAAGETPTAFSGPASSTMEVWTLSILLSHRAYWQASLWMQRDTREVHMQAGDFGGRTAAPRSKSALR
jgi:hypothetical protein